MTSRSLILIAAASASLAAPARAQMSPELVDAVPRCLDERGAGERLACFERAARAIRAAQGVPAVPDAERQRAAFGLSRERAAARAPKPRAAKPEPVRSVSAAVRKVLSLGEGYRLGLDDGSEWDVTGSSLGRAPSPGDRISIQTGVLSGYRAFIQGRPGLLRVRRVR